MKDFTPLTESPCLYVWCSDAQSLTSGAGAAGSWSTVSLHSFILAGQLLAVVLQKEETQVG